MQSKLKKKHAIQFCWYDKKYDTNLNRTNTFCLNCAFSPGFLYFLCFTTMSDVNTHIQKQCQNKYYLDTKVTVHGSHWKSALSLILFYRLHNNTTAVKRQTNSYTANIQTLVKRNFFSVFATWRKKLIELRGKKFLSIVIDSRVVINQNYQTAKYALLFSHREIN